MFNNYLHKNCARDICEASMRSWRMWEVVVQQWLNLLLAILAVRAVHLRMGSHKGQSKCWQSFLSCTWEIHLGFISHINYSSAKCGHKSPQKDWNGIISLGIISWRWCSRPRAIITQLNVQVTPSPSWFMPEKSAPKGPYFQKEVRAVQ